MIDNDTDDEWCETTERSSGVMDTLLQEPDITQDGDRILSFEPGEGNSIAYRNIALLNDVFLIEQWRLILYLNFKT